MPSTTRASASKKRKNKKAHPQITQITQIQTETAAACPRVAPHAAVGVSSITKVPWSAGGPIP
jgi:hypothetical protein